MKPESENKLTLTVSDVPDWKIHIIKVAGDDPAARRAINLAHTELDAKGWLPAIAITDFQMQAIAASYKDEEDYRAITCFSPLLRGYPCVVTLGWVAPADRNSSKGAVGILMLEQCAREAGCTAITMGIHVENSASAAMAAKLGFQPETVQVSKSLKPCATPATDSAQTSTMEA